MMILRDDLPESELLSDYLDTAYRDYREFLAVKAALEARSRMAPANAEAYGRIEGRAAARYMRQSANVRANARRKLAKERERLERAVQRANARRWERLRQVVNKRESTAARLLTDKVQRSSLEEIERLFDEGDEWARSVIAMSVDGSSAEPGSEEAAVFRRIQTETRDERYEEKLSELEARAGELRRAEEIVPQLAILEYYAHLGDVLDETVHRRALQASNDDFYAEERLTAQRAIDDVWERVAAGVPDDFEE
jgi:hypothetical protein